MKNIRSVTNKIFGLLTFASFLFGGFLLLFAIYGKGQSRDFAGIYETVMGFYALRIGVYILIAWGIISLIFRVFKIESSNKKDQFRKNRDKTLIKMLSNPDNIYNHYELNLIRAILTERGYNHENLDLEED